jgi:hypothetical protein
MMRRTFLNEQTQSRQHLKGDFDKCGFFSDVKQAQGTAGPFLREQRQGESPYGGHECLFGIAENGFW